MEKIEEFLNERKREGTLRKLRPAASRKGGRIGIDGKEYYDFSSNDYLGLSNHPKLIAAAREAAEIYGVGSSGSRLLSGDLELTHSLEEKTAEFKGKEAALVFNSGYQANVGIVSALCGPGDCIFSDKLNHASIIDGLILSGAEFFRYKHNDIEHLHSLLEKERGRFKDALIVTESIFSMDGDKPDLKSIVELKEKFGCTLLVDEAHATGIFGKNGSGVVEEEGIADRVDLIMGTFGKALGSFGAYLASSEKIVEFMINKSRNFVYSTALPPATIACNIAAINLINEEPFRRLELLENSAYFRNLLAGKGFAVKGESQIVPVIVGENDTAVKDAKALQEKGWWVMPIRPPTVPKGEARLRFSITYEHKKEVLKQLADEVL